MTKKMTHRALSLFLTLLMCLSLLPAVGRNALAAGALEPVAAGTEAIKDYLEGQETLAAGDKTYYQYVYYGGLKWRVLDGEADSGNGTGMLLLSENVLNHDTTNLGQPYNGFRTNFHPAAARYTDTTKGYAASDVRKYLIGEGTYTTFQTCRTKGNNEVAYNYIANVMYYRSDIENDPNDSNDEFDAGPQAGVTYYVIDTENYVQETETLNSGTFQHGAYYTLSGGKYTRAYTYDPSATYYYDASTYKVWSGTAFEAGQTYYRFYQATANLNAAQNIKILGTLYYVGYKINKARIISGFSASAVNFVTDFCISDIEKAAVLPATKAATPSAQAGDYNYYGGPLDNDAYFLLSAAEANDPDYGMHLQANRVANRLSGGAAPWWLRSSNTTGNAGIVTASGVFNNVASSTYTLGVRPAFYLNPASVLFASESAAAGGKSAAANGNFAAFASANTQSWKLTLLDGGLSVTPGTPSVSGNTVTLPYSAASTYGDNVYLSAIVTDGAGKQIYGYAKLAKIDAATARNGSVTMTLPTASIGGTDTQLTLDNCVVKVFLERCGGETETDYASNPTPINTPSCTGGHTWSDWQYPDDFDCAAGGTRTRYCLLCGEIETESVTAGTHTLHEHYAVAKSCKNGNGGIEAYWECEVCGRLFRDAAATQEVASLNDLLINEAHNTARVYHVASDEHFHYYNMECQEADCGLITVNRITQANWEAHTGVNCATGGTCSLCGATVAAGEHTFRTNDASTFVKYKDGYEPTCEEGGIAIYKCAVCGENGEVNVGALGHLYSGQVKVRTETYDQNGVLYQYCVRCGEPKTSEIALDRKPATIVISGQQSFVNQSGSPVTAADDGSATTFTFEHNEADASGNATAATGLKSRTNYNATIKWYQRDVSGARTVLGSAPSGIGTYSLGISAGIANTTELDANGNPVASYLAVDEVFYDFEILAPSGDNFILSFVVPNQVGHSEINHNAGTIKITMPWNTSDADLKAITPSSVTWSDSATLVTPSNANWNTQQDFTVSGGVQYTVRSQGGTDKTYWVSVERDSAQRTVHFETFGGSYHQSQSVMIGQPYGNLPTPTKQGFVFEGWYLEDGTQAGTTFQTLIESSTNVTVETDHTLYAKWRELKLLIPETETKTFTYDGTPKSYLPKAAIYGTDPKEYVEATASDSMGFVVQYKGANDTSFTGTAPSAVGTYEVKFTRPADNDYAEMTAGTGTLIITANDLDVTFDAGDHGSLSGTNPVTVVYNQPVGDHIPDLSVDAGWDFTGWASSLNPGVLYSDDAVESYVVTEDVTFTAQYAAINEGTIYVDFGGGKDGSGNTYAMFSGAGGTDLSTADARAIAALAATVTYPGHTYSEITMNGRPVTAFPTTYPEAGLVDRYVVQWTALTYKVIFHENIDPTADNTTEQTMTYDTAANLTANSFNKGDGWNFLGWGKGAGDTTATYGDEAEVLNLITPVGDAQADVVDLYAVWSANSFSINYDYDGGEVSASNPAIAKTGDTVELANEPTRTGYTFAGWESEDVDIANNSFTMPAENVTVKALWDAKENTVTFTAIEGGAVTTAPNSIKVNSGDAVGVAPEAKENPGYHFTGLWVSDENGHAYTADQVEEYVISGENDKVVFTAQFVKNANGIIIFNYNGGELNGEAYSKIEAPGESEIDSNFTAPEPEKDGWTFVGYDQDVPDTYPKAGEVLILTAQYEANDNTVTYVIPHSDKAGETITETVKTNANLASVPVSGTDFNADEGYVFNDQWECSEGGIFSLADMAKYVMPAKDVTFTAVVVSNGQLATDRTLTFDANGGTGAPEPIAVSKDSEVTLTGYTATAPDGKLFVGWAEEADGTEADVVNKVTMDADKTVYAVYKDVPPSGKYTVTFAIGENGAFADSTLASETETTVDVTAGEAIDVADIPEVTADENYTFNGWTLPGSDAVIPNEALALIPVTDNVTYTAAYTKTGPKEDTVYTLTFDAGDGTDAPAAIKLPAGETVSLEGLEPTPPADKAFDGWTLNGRVVTSVKLDADKTVVAKYSDVVKYTVTFLAGDNGTMDPDPATEDVVTGESVSGVPTITADTGYTFLGWTIGRDAAVYTDDAVKALVITRATTFTAKYSDDSVVDPDDYVTLTFDAETNGGSGAPAAIEMPANTRLSLTGYTATAPTGKVFDGWFAAATGGSALTTYTFGTADGTVYAQYSDEPAVKTFTVKFFEEDGTTQIGADQTVEEGDFATPETAPAVDGKTFAGWKDSTGTVYTAEGIANRPVTKDVDYTAFYMTSEPPVVTTNTLTFDAGDGTDAPAALPFPTGTKVSLTGFTATPPTGREFNGWKLDGVLVTEVTLDADKTVVADYTTTNPAGPFTVTFSAGTNGKMTPETYSESVIGGNAITGAVPTIKANTNYTFEGWTLNGGSTKYSSEDVAAMKITGDSSFVAYYSKTTTTGGGGGGGTTTTYTLTYQSNGGTSYASETYTSGTVARLDKVPTRAGYTFTGWYSDAALTTKITSITMDGNKTVYAGWKEGDPVKPQPTPSPYLNYADHIAFIMGYPDGTFGPNKNVTRAESTTMIYRLLTDARKNEINATTNSFSDVDSSKWYNTYVSSMAKGGYVTGYPDGTFGGERDITRAEFVTLLVRFFDPATAAISFKDVSSGHWAYKNIVTAYAYGWINGYEDGTFRPDQPITRAEAVTIINRILGRGIDASSTLGSFKNFSDNANANAWYYYEIIEAANSHEYTGERPSESWTKITD